MTTRRTELVVPDEAAGQRLDAYLGSVAEVGSRSSAARLISEGSVTIAGTKAVKSTILAGGEAVIITRERPPIEGHEPAIPFEILYEDDSLLVVDKPAGLVVHPAPGNPTGTLSQALAGRAGGGDADRPGIVHRLDKDTSGLLVVAKNEAVLRALQLALRRREVSREYTALVRGRPESPSGTIDAPLGRDRRSPKQVAIRDDSPRNAITHFDTAEEIGRFTLLNVRLETGRTHQIRVHLAAIGLPVCGDREYGTPEALGLERQFLHASRLSFEHPVTREAVSVESSLPEDLQQALERARHG
ncbi:MAG TPA: RluA family pseudouridine synthase [Solirubrobacterales bacterium]|jgi:23S rRNA pseudouridine1911/1915/1917 synthase|nr:RluA family pseudouridine synthase [Solirubrobacterales bacterium]